MSNPILAMTNDLLFWAKIKTVADGLKIPVLQVTDPRKVHAIVGQKKPAVVLLDLEAPYIDPLGTILTLKKDPMTAKTPLVGYLSHLERELGQKAKGLGCDQVLSRAEFSSHLSELIQSFATPNSAKRVAFFDVDRTLMDGYAGFYATLDLIRHKVIKKRRLPLAIFYELTSWIQHGNIRKMYEIAYEDMAGYGIDEIMEIGADCFEKSIRPRLFREAFQKIEEHKKEGDKIILLTSSPYMVVQKLAETLGADQVYTSGPVVVKGCLEPELIEPICYREGKLVFAEQVERETGIPLKDCFYYADDPSDLPLLERVGFPHLVNPRRSLARLGRERGWPVLLWSSLVGRGV
ncbi:MAG: HAD-IB family hydrolase [Deltaproteobacteria bacterium]|nr:HAD-IB family hydrolase [Deltaproteobacteria bacterium]